MRKIISLLVIALSGTLFAQTETKYDRETRTISVTAEASVSIAPDIAVLKFGVVSEAANKDQAFEANKRVAERIFATLKELGVSEKQIETEELILRPKEAEEEGPKQGVPMVEVIQTWNVRVVPASAEVVIDRVVAAGATRVDQPRWEYADAAGLQAKASAAAIKKARVIAEQMAAGMGVKLGVLLYASNRAERVVPSKGVGGTDFQEQFWLRTPRKDPKLKVFQQDVFHKETVTAAFAIE